MTKTIETLEALNTALVGDYITVAVLECEGVAELLEAASLEVALTEDGRLVIVDA